MPVRLQIRAVVTVCVVGLVLGLLGVLGTSASAGQRADWSTKVVPPTPGHVDPAPPGVDVKRKLRTDELRARAKARSERRLARIRKPTGRSHRLFTVNSDPRTAAANTPAGVSALPGLAAHVDTSCTGTGVDGNRVQALYVVEADDTDRFTGVLPILREELANVDDTFALSAAQTGGGVRVRWVLDPVTCQPVVQRLQVPAGALTSFASTIAAAKVAGYTAVNRKYLMFADAAVLCGIGHLFDDSSRSGNLNDGAAAMYSRVDTGCWQAGDHGSSAAHELMHNLGGVQSSAVNATPYGHCDDDSDLMCYADGPGVTMTSVCAPSNEPLFDCRNDDYFSTNPAPGSYLATSWNTADSSFLDRVHPLTPVDPVTPVVEVEPEIPLPTVTVSGPATVRPGLPATLTATGSVPGSVTWLLSDTRCVNGSTTTPTLVVQCPSYRSGAVRATATFTDAGGRTARAVHDVDMGGTPTALTLTLTPSGGTHYVGRPLSLTTRVRFGSVPVRGWVAVWSSTDGRNWSPVTGSVDTGTDGVLVTTVRPARRTSYQAAVTAGPGWGLPRNPVISVPVVKRPVRLAATARSGRPDLVTGKLIDAVTGSVLAGRKLRLQKRLYGTSTWRLVKTVTTGTGGYAKARVQPRRMAYYRWVYAGSSTYRQRTSGRVFLRY